MNRELLKNLLETPSKTFNEFMMVNFLENYLFNKEYKFTTDKHNNIYVTKGKAEFYPCVIAHIDTVHSMQLIQTYEVNGKIYGREFLTNKPVGIGGDDKAGIFICLELLEKLQNVKVALFAAEEVYCVGSRSCNRDFFEDVGYIIQFDAPDNNLISYSSNGTILYDKNGDFIKNICQVFKDNNIVCTQEHHPYTDIHIMKKYFDVSCVNLSAGYHDFHTSGEYVVVEEIEQMIKIGQEIIQILDEKQYPFSDKDRELNYHFDIDDGINIVNLFPKSLFKNNYKK